LIMEFGPAPVNSIIRDAPCDIKPAITLQSGTRLTWIFFVKPLLFHTKPLLSKLKINIELVSDT